jgi:hypothetical protein
MVTGKGQWTPNGKNSFNSCDRQLNTECSQSTKVKNKS